MRARPLTALILTATLAALAGCVDRLDYASNVHDLRVLAVRSEPPEALIDPAKPMIPVFQLRALVGDAEGVVRERSFRFTTCPSAPELRCEGEEGAVVLGQGTVAGREASLDFIPTAAGFDVQKAIDEDPYRGFGGLPLIVTLRVAADGEEVWAAKRVVISTPMPFAPGQKANVNPAAPELLLRGEPFAADARPELRGGQFKLDVAAPDPSAKEEYVVPTFDKGSRTLTETFEYSWFTTKGHFGPERTGGWDVIAQDEEKTETHLIIDSDESPGEFSIWVVVRDGRGGETWTERRAVWLGP